MPSSSSFEFPPTTAAALASKLKVCGFWVADGDCEVDTKAFAVICVIDLVLEPEASVILAGAATVDDACARTGSAMSGDREVEIAAGNAICVLLLSARPGAGATVAGIATVADVCARTGSVTSGDRDVETAAGAEIVAEAADAAVSVPALVLLCLLWFRCLLCAVETTAGATLCVLFSFKRPCAITKVDGIAFVVDAFARIDPCSGGDFEVEARACAAVGVPLKLTGTGVVVSVIEAISVVDAYPCACSISAGACVFLFPSLVRSETGSKVVEAAEVAATGATFVGAVCLFLAAGALTATLARAALDGRVRACAAFDSLTRRDLTLLGTGAGATSAAAVRTCSSCAGSLSFARNFCCEG